MVTLFRGLLTGALVAAISKTGKPVGNSSAPSGGGWQAPAAPDTEFIPYVVVNPMPASISSGNLSESQTEFQMPYNILSFGVSGDQVEWMADNARAMVSTTLQDAIIDMGGGFGSDLFKVQQVFTNSLGPVSRQDVTDPPFFTQSDVVTIWLTKE